ncbi:MAG: CbiX/SirB N-terminal domain-containing protein [Acidobacteria bacterium]|nr:CbiX/SirB N-terminal domain-containing protein [Acidobacteriota bacterium]
MKEPVTAILIFAHGSAVPEANQSVVRLAEEVSRRTNSPAACAFLELAQPDLAATVAGFVATGIRRIVVIPYFLSMGVHVRQDLPRLIEQQRALFPKVEILVGQSLESHPGMAEVVLDRVRETLPNGGKL